MATIKAFSDLEQSRKLAEILPLENADMYYMETSCNNYTTGVLQRMERNMLIKQAEYYKMFPCWSLAALLNVIPQEIFNGEYIINITEGLDNKWIVSYESHYEISSYINVSSDSLVDCCVEMIIKLKERNLLNK